MRLAPPLRIVGVAVVLAAALVGLVVREGAARAAGTEVLLGMAGFDPRSPLSGHYMAFRLQDAAAGGGGCPAALQPYEVSGPQWIALRREGRVHRVAGLAQDRSGAQALGEVAVRGRIACHEQEGRTQVELQIGVDRFHAGQAEAEAMERALRGSGEGPPDAFAVVSLGRDGKARLKGVIINGRRTDLDWF